VRESIHLLRSEEVGLQATPLERSLARDGFVVEAGDHGAPHRLRAALPEEIRLADTDDEVRQLLKSFSFAVPLGHLDQAIEAHTRGDWAACNGQLRTFLESLFEDIAFRLNPDEAGALQSSENRRELLARMGFLSTDRNEWSRDQKAYLNGLLKMLHTEGSHPGLSDEDRATFRLHVVMVTARTFLRRLHNRR